MTVAIDRDLPRLFKLPMDNSVAAFTVPLWVKLFRYTCVRVVCTTMNLTVLSTSARGIGGRDTTIADVMFISQYCCSSTIYRRPNNSHMCRCKDDRAEKRK